MDPEVGQRVRTKLEYYKWLYVSLEILVGTTLENQSDPLVQLILEGGPYGPLWNTLRLKKSLLEIAKLSPFIFDTMHETTALILYTNSGMEGWTDWTTAAQTTLISIPYAPHKVCIMYACSWIYTTMFPCVLLFIIFEVKKFNTSVTESGTNITKYICSVSIYSTKKHTFF